MWAGFRYAGSTASGTISDGIVIRPERKFGKPFATRQDLSLLNFQVRAARLPACVRRAHAEADWVESGKDAKTPQD